MNPREIAVFALPPSPNQRRLFRKNPFGISERLILEAGNCSGPPPVSLSITRSNPLASTSIIASPAILPNTAVFAAPDTTPRAVDESVAIAPVENDSRA
jgi:hypothetical protein